MAGGVGDQRAHASSAGGVSGRSAEGQRGSSCASLNSTFTGVAPIPRFPAVVRDISIQVDARVTAASLRATITAAAGPLLEELREFGIEPIGVHDAYAVLTGSSE